MEGDLWERKVLVTGLDFSYILRLVFSLCRGGDGARESAPNSFPDNLGSFPDSSVGKESACNAGNLSLIRFLVGKICWRRDGLATPAFLGFPCGSAGKESTCNAGDLGWIPGLGRSSG